MCVHTKWVHTYPKLTRIETKLLNVVTTEYSVVRIKGKLKFFFQNFSHPEYITYIVRRAYFQLV